jgi:hypothetical protein
MTRRIKITAALLLLSLLALHFTLVTITAVSPDTSSKLRFIAWYYNYPFFQQNWNLFVPPPSNNYNLYASFECEGQKNLDVFSDILQRHSNRLAGYEPLVIAVSNSIYYFDANYKKPSSLNGPVRNDERFRMLEHFSQNYLEHLFRKKVNNLKLILVISSVKNKEQRIYFN